VTIRTFQPGDEAAQVAIYNEAAAALPKFKAATLQEVQRRTRARDFDPAMRFYAIEGGKPVGYALFNANGRVSYPWCLSGHEDQADALFAHVLDAMVRRKMPLAFAAYRGDWQPVCDFFGRHGFGLAREMVNFLLDVIDMPTAPARMSSTVSPLRREDVPAILQLAPEALRVRTAEGLEEHLFRNPYFGPEALFTLRSRTNDSLVAVGILIQEPTYADPKQVDPAMPCFRLGAFGTEGMQAKRIRGMFSFLTHRDQQVGAVGLDLLGHAAMRLSQSDDIHTLAAQVPSDVPHLLRFYERNFRKQASFPVFERTLTAPQ
jgi:hypothetical protein